MFDINAYPAGYTVVELEPHTWSDGKSPGAVVREFGPAPDQTPPEAPKAVHGPLMFTEAEAKALADALNMAERMIYTVTLTMETKPGHNGGLSHAADERSSTQAWTFKGPRAHERAVECYQREASLIRQSGPFPGYVHTIEMSAAVHSIRLTEV